MALDHEIERQGHFLFRHRSFFPLLSLPVFAGAFGSYRYLHDSHQLTEAWQAVCFALSLLGLALRVYTVGFVPARTSGRNTQAQVADRLNTTGAYSLLRHPLYFGNWLMWLGVSCLFRSWWLPLLVTTLFVLQYERIMFAEELFLRSRFGSDFDRWAERTPAFIPRLGSWRAPTLPFCWRSALRREHTGVLAITVIYFLFDAIGDSLVEGRPCFDPAWIALMSTVTTFYLVTRTLGRRTRWLHAHGR